jgi:hypothetical protein
MAPGPSTAPTSGGTATRAHRNCWFNNEGWDGSRGSLTAFPPIAPAQLAGESVPPFLPEDCATSVGTGGAAQEAELLGCLASFSFDVDACPWFSTPAKP